MSDYAALKVRLGMAIQKSEQFVNQTHVAAEIKSIFREMKDICEGFEFLLNNQKDGSADARFMKKKLEQSTKDMTKIEARLETVKQSVGDLVAEIKVIVGETANILKRHDPTTGDEDGFSALKIKASAQKLAEVVVKLSSG